MAQSLEHRRDHPYSITGRSHGTTTTDAAAVRPGGGSRDGDRLPIAPQQEETMIHTAQLDFSAQVDIG